MKAHIIRSRLLAFFLLNAILFLSFSSCSDDDNNRNGDDGEPNEENGDAFDNSEIVFLLIDEDAIDNGNEPNNFSETDVNDNIADIGQRQTLKYFQDNIGRVIDLYSGQVGDEAWFALKSIPDSWITTGPTSNGLQNYLTPGPGLGAPGDDREVLLDEIPNVTPLRAAGLKMLEGETVYAVVYDSDISINYDPIEGNLQGDNLGIVAFDVIDVTARNDGSSSDLPRVTIRIRNAIEIAEMNLALFSNAPVPESSSEPLDITPPESPEPIVLSPAR
ncbi:hypothetical protein [Christiangramia sediminis]|uniref:Uncharacterized protein n=1 Tax=Christiangramia sediminis TaxID=2881336 RepID=A0A9X1RX17_9FLAO|nr:hypothetical protein [Christiangramia sediminis]MCB7480742.1 hypothetical protein [Christiangramia sediminis]